jgi:hypothetical protein
MHQLPLKLTHLQPSPVIIFFLATAPIQSLHAGFSGEFRLGIFNQLFNSLRVGFGMAVAANGIAAAGRFNEDIGPNEPRFDMDRRHFGDAHALLVLAEKRSLASGNGFIANLDVSGKEEVAFGPTAGFEGLERHELK